jgi:hypothetical protein
MTSFESQLSTSDHEVFYQFGTTIDVSNSGI